MLGRMAAALAVIAVAVFTVSPAHAQADDADFPGMVRSYGDMVGGEQAGRGEFDKIVQLGRNAQGGLVIEHVTITVLNAPWPTVPWPPGTVAVMRTRAATANGNSGPEPADLDHAVRTGIPVLVVGDWRSPPVIWQIEREGSRTRVREIDAKGVPGPWQSTAQ